MAKRKASSSKPSKSRTVRAPSSLACLGDVLDLRIEHKGRRWRQTFRKFLLCSDTSKRTLWLLPKPPKRRAVPLDGHGEAGDVRRMWSSMKPDDAFAVRADVKSAVLVGHVNSLAYRSDKWSGDRADYEHDFDTPPVLEKCGSVYRVRGGNVRVTPRGITG